MFSIAPRIAPHMSTLPAALVSAFVVLSLPNPAEAQPSASATDPVRTYQLDVAPLPQTLDAIATTSGRRVEFDRAALGGIQGRSVRGDLSAGAAIAKALTDTGYVLDETVTGVLAIKPVATVLVTARDEAETSFKATRSDTATRSGADLHNVPGGITLITSKVLETQQITNVQDALRNVSGINFQQTPGRPPTFSVRGFTAATTTNGVRDKNGAATDVFGVERIEVLKGPQAILAGGDADGGAVNIVLKKPTTEVVRDLTLRYGSNVDRTIAADLAGPLDSSKRLTYRLIGATAKSSRSDGGYDGRKHNSFTPSLRWKNETIDIIVSASYSDQHIATPLYTFVRRDGAILPPPGGLLSRPRDGIDVTSKRLNYQFEYAFSPALKLISRVQHSDTDTELRSVGPIGLEYAEGAADDAPESTMSFYSSRIPLNERTQSGDHYLRYILRTGLVLHKISFGLNHSKYAVRQTEFSGPFATGQIYPTVDVLFPDLSTDVQFAAQSSYGNQQRGVYLQDMASFGKWTAMVNLRRNQYTSSPVSISLAEAGVFNEPAARIYQNSPGAGVVYELNDRVSLYANYAEGFISPNAVSCVSGLTPPSLTRNKEAGAKFDLLDNKLSLTTSVFSLTQTNSSRYNALSNCFDVADGQRTKGFEIDMQGQILRGLDVVMNYTYNKLDDAGANGDVFPGVPKHKFSTWGVYRFQNVAYNGLGIGLGVNASSASLGSFDSSAQFNVPGQTQFDASVFYEYSRWNLTFGIKNVADRRLYGTATSASYIPVLPGRVYMLTLKTNFN